MSFLTRKDAKGGPDAQKTLSALPEGLVDRVFGVDRTTNPLSYVERDIDANFKAALTSGRYSAIVIFGTSKQGKSSLRRHILPEPFCTFVSATAGMNQERLYRNLLNQAQATGPVTITQNGTVSVSGEAEFKVPAWLSAIAFKMNASVVGQIGRRWEEVGIDLSDADGVARHYVKAVGPKPIVIDNFHYFTPQMQRDFSIDIRAFEERGVKIVVMGTWKARNYLEMQNGDLAGTVCPLSIEPWSNADFRRVIDEGQKRLGIEFNEPAREALVSKAAGNIGLLQTALNELVKTATVGGHSPLSWDERTVRGIYRGISAELLESMVGKLKKIAEIGEAWLKGKTRTYYILRAFIDDQESNNIEGVALARLFERTNRMIAKLGGSQSLNEQAFATLVRRDLLAGQQQRIETPLVAFDPEGSWDGGRLIALDSWLLVTIRNHRQEMLARF